MKRDLQWFMDHVGKHIVATIDGEKMVDQIYDKDDAKAMFKDQEPPKSVSYDEFQPYWSEHEI